MTTCSKIGFFAGALALCCLTSASRADDKPAPTGSGSAVAGQSLNDASLEQMLKNMGYNPGITKSANGKVTYYHLELAEPSFTFVVDVSVDESGSRIWFSAPFAQIPEKEMVAGTGLLRLLEVNDKIGPAWYSYCKAHERFYLNMTIDNREISAAVLRKELSRFLHTIENTYEVWKGLNPQTVNASATSPGN